MELSATQVLVSHQVERAAGRATDVFCLKVGFDSMGGTSNKSVGCVEKSAAGCVMIEKVSSSASRFRQGLWIEGTSWVRWGTCRLCHFSFATFFLCSWTQFESCCRSMLLDTCGWRRCLLQQTLFTQSFLQD